jgi:hypothetical protein
MGLDAWVSGLYRHVRRWRLGVAFDRAGFGFLVRGYRRTFGVPFEDWEFDQCHRWTGRRVGQTLSSLPLLEALTEGNGGPPPLPALRWALRTAFRSGPFRHVALAYLTPVRPSPWLADAFDTAVSTYEDLFLEAVETGGASLEDRNLDTGRPCDLEVGHGGRRGAIREMLVRGGGGALPVPAVARVGSPGFTLAPALSPQGPVEA